jgi:uncharacterized Zn finger protein
MITEAEIRGLTTAQSFSRGEEYYHCGAVGAVVRRGNTLVADVAGSNYQPYRVTIELSDEGVVDATCTCPYDWGGYCKHIVAVLLTAVQGVEEIEERPTAAALLANVDVETLRRLLSGLLVRHPELIVWVEAQLALGSRAASISNAASQPVDAQLPRRAPVDAAAIRRLVRAEMRAPDDYYATSGVVSGLEAILQQARRSLEAGDGEGALVVVEALAGETIPGWEEHDDSDGEFGGWFSDLGEVFTEALLTADLPPAERRTWARKLEKWQAELDDYGVDEAFDAAIAAAEQGWDYEPLRRALAGMAEPDEAWDDEAPWFADALTTARLNVLERQGRTEEFLNLAEIEGETVRYVTMLVKTGRAQEAVDYGLRNFTGLEEALALAQILHERGETRSALQIGEHGLGLSGYRLNDLARWLREAAAGAGEYALALRAARIAFTTSAALADYQAIRALTGDGWSAIKAELLAELATRDDAHERTDIYLFEGMIDEAVRAIDARSYVGLDEIAKVASAAWQSHPDWVIRQCRSQAEPIMDEGRSKYYGSAIGWLQIARRAYDAAGRTDEWQAYCQGLIARHGRKYSLVPQLKRLL